MNEMMMSPLLIHQLARRPQVQRGWRQQVRLRGLPTPPPGGPTVPLQMPCETVFVISMFRRSHTHTHPQARKQRVLLKLQVLSASSLSMGQPQQQECGKSVACRPLASAAASLHRWLASRSADAFGRFSRFCSLRFLL